MSQQLSLFAIGDKQTASWTKADPTLLRRKDELAAGGPPGWRPNRLILMNYWHFTYEEFHFVQGRLVLRGANGSGKSTALAAAITLTLDGEKRRERMDTFGGQGRSVAYYLVGPPDGAAGGEFYHQERTAYVVLEFEHGTQRRYASIGVGLYTSRGRPNLDVDFWGFTLDDGRRPGIDFPLWEETADGRIPLTERQLRERVGPGGRVTDRQGEYQNLVNDLLFGMPEEEYDDLLKVLVQLRSPKLNKDIKPSDVCTILTRSLQPLPEGLLARVTRIIEDIDSQQDLLDRTRRNLAAARDLDEKLDRYLNQLAQQAALDYREARATLAEARATLAAAEARLAEAEAELAAVGQRLHQLSAERTRVQGRLEALERSDAFAQEKDLEQVEADRDSAKAALAAAQQGVAQSREALERLAREAQRLTREWAEAVAELRQGLQSLGEQAQAAAWPLAGEALHETGERLADLRLDEPRADSASRLAPVLQLGSGRVQALRAALGTAEAVEKAQAQHKAVQETLRQAEYDRDSAADNLAEAEDRLAEAREAGVEAIHLWRTQLAEPRVAPGELEPLVAAVREYPLNGADLPAVADHTVAPLLRRQQAELERQVRALQGERAECKLRSEALYQELSEWMNRTEAEPPRRPSQAEARQLLAAQSVPAVPLYAACDFRPDLDPTQAAQLEAALEEAGLLDALLVPVPHAAEVERILAGQGLGDRWLQPAPLTGTPTLADYMVPVPGQLDAASVESALRTVAVGAPGDGKPAVIAADGRWQVGPLAGLSTSPRDAAVQFIGAENRRRRREAEIARLRQALEAVQTQEKLLDEALTALAQRIEAMGAAREALRTLDHWESLRRAAGARSQAEAWLKRCQDQVEHHLQTERKAYAELQAARVRWQEALVAAPECRGRTAEAVRELIEATQVLVQGVRYMSDQLTGLRRLQESWTEVEQQRAAAGQRLQADMDAEQAARGRFEQLNQRAEALLERLLGLGVERIRQELAELKGQLACLAEEKERLIGHHAALEEKARQQRADVTQAKQAAAALDAAAARALTGLTERLRAYPTLREHLDRAVSGEEAALACAEELLRYRRTGPEGLRKAIEESQKEAYRYLMQAFEGHKSELAEYAPELEGDLVLFHVMGVRLLPCDLRERLENDYQWQQSVVREKENELYEDFILRQVAGDIRELVGRVKEWRDRVNHLLAERKLTNGEVLSIDWRPKPPDRVTGVDMGRVVELLQQDPDKLPQEQVQELIGHFRSRVEEVRQRERRGEQEQSFADALAEVLDYRLWFDFTLHSRLPGQERQLVTDIKFTARSGAEKSLAMFIPLLTAAYARYDSAAPDAPRLVGLDEAFAGVDEQNTREMFRFLVDLNFSWIMTSEKLWGVSETLPGCATYELVRRGNVVTPIFYLWDGTRRHGSLESALGEVASSRERD